MSIITVAQLSSKVTKKLKVILFLYYSIVVMVNDNITHIQRLDTCRYFAGGAK